MYFSYRLYPVLSGYVQGTPGAMQERNQRGVGWQGLWWHHMASYLLYYDNLHNYINIYTTSEDLSKLKYITMCVKETMRLFPIAPYVAKLLSEDVIANGQRIPKGMSVICTEW